MTDGIGPALSSVIERADPDVTIAEVIRRLDAIETRFSTMEQAQVIMASQSSDTHANLKWLVGQFMTLLEIAKTLPGMGAMLRDKENSRG